MTRATTLSEPETGEEEVRDPQMLSGRPASPTVEPTDAPTGAPQFRQLHR